MNELLILLNLIIASIFAFLKLFNKSIGLLPFLILGVVYSIFEFVFRIPSVIYGKTMNISVILLQIIWIALNFIISSLLGVYLFNERLGHCKVAGMLIILLGIYISTN